MSDKIPEGMEDQVKEYREALLEGVVEMDDEAMEAYLEVGDGLAGKSRCIKQCPGKISMQNGSCPTSKSFRVLWPGKEEMDHEAMEAYLEVGGHDQCFCCSEGASLRINISVLH